MSLAETGRLMQMAAADAQARTATIETRRDRANQIAIDSSADEVCKRLVKEIVDFEGGLNENLEVGIRLVSFGQTVIFRVRDLSWEGPTLIVFGGTTDDGHEVRLIQHLSQLSFLLMAVERLNPNEPRTEMGYHALYREWFGQGTNEASEG